MTQSTSARLATTSPVCGQTDFPVPFVDLTRQHERVAGEIMRRIGGVIDATSFVLGPEVSRFEREYAEFCEVEHCIGVGNGTDAIELALRGARVGPGDEVIIPTNTFVATAEAVVRSGATLVLADCNADFLLDADQVAAKLTPRTKAVIAVDLYGQIADMEGIKAAAGDSVLLIEDAAQSQGATRWGRMAGSFGVAAATSFYPGKNLGAFGDAGAVMTQDDEVATRIRAMRNHGGQKRYEHVLLGTNSRLDSIQAAVLSVKLAELPRWNDQRAQAARRYRELLAEVGGIELPHTVDGNEHVWHLYVIRVPERDRVIAEMSARGIGAGIHYPVPVHRIPAFSSPRYSEGDFAVADRMADEILSLPIFPGITPSQQERVVDVVQRALR